MNESSGEEANGFLSATQLLKVRGIRTNAWDDCQQSEIALPKTGKKYFEPTGSWLQDMQLENGIKNRKKLLEIERVERAAQLAVAEWLPGIQKARVTKKSGQTWEYFGHEEKLQFYLLPEEALILLEMNCLELLWNGMPLSVQQAYEVIINSSKSKCTLDEYRVYSQLIKCGYKLQRFREKLSLDSKSSNTVKRIIMNPEGLWTPNLSPAVDKYTSDTNGSTSFSKANKEDEDNINILNMDKSENGSAKASRLGIISEETVLGNIKIVKNNTSPPLDVSASSNTNQVNKWPGARIQRNVKLMPKRNDKQNHLLNSNCEVIENSPQKTAEKRRNSVSIESVFTKKSRPEVIELSDDEIEEIPRPMSRMDILNTLPNLADNGDSIVAEIPRAYIPHTIKPSKDFYHYDRRRLLNLTQSDNMYRSNMEVVPVNNVHNGQTSNYYSQRSQCQAITTFGSNNGYSYRGMRCQRDGNSYVQHNISHNTIHSPYSGTVVQSNYVNFVMEVMGNMVLRSFRQQQFHQTTFCQNVQFFSPRFPYHHRYQPYPINYYPPYPREPYYRRGGAPGNPLIMQPKNRGYRNSNSEMRMSHDEPSQPSFSKRPGVSTWSDLKRKWRDESTITIEDEEPLQMDDTIDCNEVQVVDESVRPLINSKSQQISNLSEVYERLRLIKSAADRTVRSRKIDYTLSYEVYGVNQPFKKSSPGTPICRLYIINSRKDPEFDTSKLQRLQQESKNVPVVVAFVSESCISYTQQGVVLLPNLA